jgi:tetratricopeptide (TPR) repeat protein
MSRLIQQGLPLVRLRGELKAIEMNDISVDPFFLLNRHAGLQVSPWVDKEATLGCLGHRILGQPADLRAHVQRVFLLIKIADSAALYSALLDLMIALGVHGQALKQRMLTLAKPLLASATFGFLQQHLDAGFAPNDPHLTRVRGSLLRVSTEHGQPLVQRNGSHSTPVVSVLDQANSLLEYGQLEHAVELLENALLLDPDQEAEARLLLELYRTMKAEARWQGMCEQLQLNFGHIPKAWLNPA